jgi:hypothetical protein
MTMSIVVVRAVTVIDIIIYNPIIRDNRQKYLDRDILPFIL